MLKKVRVECLRLGVYIHALEGAWVDHPFWRTKFVLTDAADLAKLQQSDVVECWIDVGLGLDVLEPTTPGLIESGAASPPESRPPAAIGPASRMSRLSREDENGRAVRVIGNARKTIESLFREARLGRALQTAQCADLVEEVSSSVQRNGESIISLSRLKTHDNYSYMHSVAVCALMVSLARQMNMDETMSRQAGMAGLLHDIGKAVMPLEVLNKPGKLTEAEFDIMRGHPKAGHALLLGGAGVDEVVLDVCLHHHETMIGTGYPDRLPKEELSQFARMGAVCDVYDAISSDRPYKKAWDPAEAISQMAAWATKGQFDEQVFGRFVTVLGIYPTGALVRLASGMLAVVIEQNPARILEPTVRVFFSTKSGMQVPTRVIDLSSPGTAERIVARESNEVWKFKNLDELWAGAEALSRLRRAL